MAPAAAQVRGSHYWGAESSFIQRVSLTVSALQRLPPPPPAEAAAGAAPCADSAATGSEGGCANAAADVYTIGFDETNERYFRNVRCGAPAPYSCVDG